MQKTVLPLLDESSFNCPHYGAYSHQNWKEAMYSNYGGLQKIEGLNVAFCTHCNDYSIWLA